MMTLNINKLRNEVEEREKKKINTFEKVLDMCFKKILHSNQNYNDYNCIFSVPNFVFGLPLYDVGECCRFIIAKLIEKGFEVYLAVPTSLHISWKLKDKINDNYINYNNTRQQLQHNNIETSNNKQIAIKSRNGIQNNNKRNENQNENQNENKNETKNLQYRPINDYKYSKNTIYDSNDLELFRNKLDNLFD